MTRWQHYIEDLASKKKEYDLALAGKDREIETLQMENRKYKHALEDIAIDDPEQPPSIMAKLALYGSISQEERATLDKHFDRRAYDHFFRLNRR